MNCDGHRRRLILDVEGLHEATAVSAASTEASPEASEFGSVGAEHSDEHFWEIVVDVREQCCGRDPYVDRIRQGELLQQVMRWPKSIQQESFGVSFCQRTSPEAREECMLACSCRVLPSIFQHPFRRQVATGPVSQEQPDLPREALEGVCSPSWGAASALATMGRGLLPPPPAGTQHLLDA
jgi:hypothetical protein